MDIKARIKELVEKLNKWSDDYYNKNESEVSDLVYDAHYQELLLLEKDNPDLILNNSPTQKVGFVSKSNFKKVKHDYPMLSIANSFSNEDLEKWDARIKKAINNNESNYWVEFKIDGLSISIKYENGEIVDAITRGDGVMGESVLNNVLQISDIPKKINYKKSLEVRGEIFIKKSIFNKINKDEKYANPRNLASGTLRQLNAKVVKERNLSSFMYGIPNPEDHNINTMKELFNFLKSNNFNVNNESVLVKSIGDVQNRINELTTLRTNLDYETDGIVMKVNELKYNEQIGYTVKAPKYIMAYKFPEEVADTKLLDIFPTVGRTGRITYNAKLERVRLAGSYIEAATLHNADYIRKLNIQVGDIVKIKKAGEIIPKVIGITKKINNTPWVEHKNCPYCNTTLVRLDGEVDQYCTNNNCEQVKFATIEHFVSREAMNIEGISSQIIKKFMELKLITDIASIYELKDKRDKLISLEGFQSKSVDKLLLRIEESKNRPLHKLIFGLGIRHVGSKVAKIIVNKFNTIDQLLNLKYDDLISIENIGETIATSFIEYINEPKNIELINKLIKHGLNIEQEIVKTSSKLKDAIFVLTGSLSKPRSEFISIIEANGGKVASSVSSKTTHLLVGENPGSKINKINKKEVKIIREEEFNTLVGRTNG